MCLGQVHRSTQCLLMRILLLLTSEILEKCSMYPLWSPHLQHPVCPMYLRLTFPVSQSHSKVHWGVARVSFSGEIGSSGCEAQQVLQGVLGLGVGSPEWGAGPAVQ